MLPTLDTVTLESPTKLTDFVEASEVFHRRTGEPAPPWRVFGALLVAGDTEEPLTEELQYLCAVPPPSSKPHVKFLMMQKQPHNFQTQETSFRDRERRRRDTTRFPYGNLGRQDRLRVFSVKQLDGMGRHLPEESFNPNGQRPDRRFPDCLG